MSKIELQQSAPDFALDDMHGNKVRLADFRDRSNVILIFNRGFI